MHYTLNLWFCVGILFILSVGARSRNFWFSFVPFLFASRRYKNRKRTKVKPFNSFDLDWVNCVQIEWFLFAVRDLVNATKGSKIACEEIGQRREAKRMEKIKIQYASPNGVTIVWSIAIFIKTIQLYFLRLRITDARDKLFFCTNTHTGSVCRNAWTHGWMAHRAKRQRLAHHLFLAATCELGMMAIANSFCLFIIDESTL